MKANPMQGYTGRERDGHRRRASLGSWYARLSAFLQNAPPGEGEHRSTGSWRKSGGYGMSYGADHVLRPLALALLCLIYIHHVPAGTEGWWVMAVKRKARGKAERRTAPAKGAKKSGLRRAIAATRRNRPAEKRKAAAKKAPPIFHTIDAAEFVSTPEEGGAHFGPRKGQRTSCCGIPIGKNTSVATSRQAIAGTVQWCPKAVA